MGKVRLNDNADVVRVVREGLQRTGGYCPCQVPSAATKCHCKDFLKVKKIGEPCICGIYVKVAK